MALVLEIESGDVDALRCKVFALTKRSKFAEVVSASHGVADGEVKFSRAYALYRLGNVSEVNQRLMLFIKRLPYRHWKLQRV